MKTAQKSQPPLQWKNVLDMARKYEKSQDWASMQTALRFISTTAEKEIARAPKQ